ncbi:hypothetical protein Ari01nite_93120 [Paractinoplanes rishiriensis]|uniref:Voltage-gated potassium channel n=2 Tax=Paractinoplanes rishiriensis TaxID=1050105 RepID=A0A919KAN2_9ACTN|nr:hypothetical protein Ari01nite_93120 [Actinoplanes rishiriensis]
MTEKHPPTVRRGTAGAEELARRLDRPMGVLGLIFLFVVLGQLLAHEAALAGVLTVAGWILWAIFAGEFVLRAYIARDQRRFWSRHWWQLLFLAVPFLRFARAFSLLRFARFARAGTVVSAAVRGSRSAGRLLSDRIAWLAAVTAVVVLASSQLLYVAGSYDQYGPALHDAVLATVSGQPLGRPDGFARILEILLAIYSIAVFATLAAALGAYFVRQPPPPPPSVLPTPLTPADPRSDEHR